MILLAYGTRPEWIKIKPIIDELKKNNFEYQTLFTGQQINIGEFEYDWILNIVDKPNRLDSIVSSITGQLWEFFRFFVNIIQKQINLLMLVLLFKAIQHQQWQ